jgi:tRNA-dihydrouridine synthase B
MDIDFSRPLTALAPLAGYTDLPFRAICKKFGVDVTFSEMISANALAYNSKKTFHMLSKDPSESPYIVQIAGSDIRNIIKALDILNDVEGIDGIDLNCGCPVPKVIAQTAGSALLRELPLMARIIETIKKHSNKRYTSVKTRIGFADKEPQTIAKAIEDAGADFISIHGRTRAGAYKAPIDYEAIAQAKAAVKIPVFANGDITSYERALEVRAITKCEGLMIGRGAIGNPWLFYQLAHDIPEMPKNKIREIVLEHLELMREFYGAKMGVVLFRKHLHAYSKSCEGAGDFRHTINSVSDYKQMRQMCEEFFA